MKESIWSEKMKTFLKELYPEHTNAEIAKILNISESSVSAQAFKLKLFKTEEFHR